MWEFLQDWSRHTPAAGYLAALGVYLLLARACLSRSGAGGTIGFALVNLAASVGLILSKTGAIHPATVASLLIVYLAVVGLHWWCLDRWGTARGWRGWMGPLLPVGGLAAVRMLPTVASVLIPWLPARFRPLDPPQAWTTVFLGASYLAFRTSALAVEVRNQRTSRPGFWEYLGFAFFAPTLQVGPISPYSLHSQVHAPVATRPRIDPGVAALRILVGATKAFFLGALLWKFTYRQLLLDGRPHGLLDFAVAPIAYYLFLYCNFSGFCDMAVGVGGLVGVPVAENFDRPLSARNIREFWNRWHITLSAYMRDLVFVLVSKELVRRCGPARTNDAIAVATTVVFLLIGIWHGFGWNYAAFGASQALGVVANLYYGSWLKARLGKVRFKAYMENRGVHAVAVGVTFAYVAASLAFFANDLGMLWSLGQLLTE